jgi:hypothetical protein
LQPIKNVLLALPWAQEDVNACLGIDVELSIIFQTLRRKRPERKLQMAKRKLAAAKTNY